MPTLHIQHAISDFDTWVGAFDRFENARTQAGVRAHQVLCRIDDPNYVVIDLEFDTTGEAIAFRDFLQTHIWANPTNAPALIGVPETMILTPAPEQPIGASITH